MTPACMYVPLYLSWNKLTCYFKPWLCPNCATDMNSSVKAIEGFEPTVPVESSKKWNAFSGWWHSMGFHHCSQSFCYPPLYLGSGSDYFAFAATFKECGLSIITLSYLVKSSHFNMSMSAKTVGHLSNKMFNVAWWQWMYVKNNFHTF